MAMWTMVKRITEAWTWKKNVLCYPGLVPTGSPSSFLGLVSGFGSCTGPKVIGASAVPDPTSMRDDLFLTPNSSPLSPLSPHRSQLVMPLYCSTRCRRRM